MKKNRIIVSLMVSALTCVHLSAQDQVVLTTTKAVGETITLQVNQVSKGITVDWGDGVTTTVSPTSDDLLTLEGTVKGADIKLSTDSKLNTLICSGASLSALDVTKAPNLYSLYCQDNALATLDLSKCAKLTDLNCSRNKLTGLTVTEDTHPQLENFMAEGNGLHNTVGSGSSFVLRNANLQYVDISNNAISSVTIAAVNTKLDVLKCQSNALTRLTLTYPQNISVLMAGKNEIKSIVLPNAGLLSLRQLFLDENKLATIDLSPNTSLQYVSLANNELTAVTLPEKKKLYAYVCGGNHLSVSSLPSATYKPDNISYLPQDGEIDITSKLKKTTDGIYYALLCPSWKDRNTKEYFVDLTDWALDPDGGKTSIKATLYGKEEGGESQELTRWATANNPGDYFAATGPYFGNYVFMKPLTDVYVQFDSDTYPELKSRTISFNVYDKDLTGINDVIAQSGNGVVVSVSGNTLQISTDKAAHVKVYSIDGKMVWGGEVNATPTTVTLPNGVYIVNGKKYII